MAEITVGTITAANTVNSAPRIQAALDAIEALGGGIVRLTGGKYYIGDGGAGDQGLKIGSNTHLLLDQDAVIIRNFNSGGTDQAVIRNKHQDTGDEYIRVSGGSMDNEAGFAGHHLGFLNVDFLNISDMQFLGIVHWNVSLRNCDDVVVSNLLMDSGTELHSAGIQISGGSRYVIADCAITCGDDCIALVIDTFQVSSISDVVISNCYLRSYKANVLKILIEPNVTQLYTITRVAINNIVAKSGVPGAAQSGGIVIQDGKELQLITNVEIDGFILDASETATEPLVVQCATGVRLARVVIRDSKVRSRIAGSHNVSLIDCVIELHPQASGQQCLLIAQNAGSPTPRPANASCTHIRIVGGEYRGAGQHSIHMGTGNFSVNAFEISHALIDGAENNGILIWNSYRGTVIGNHIMECDDFAIQEVAPSDKNLILGNYLHANGTPLSFVGAETQAVRNWVDGGIPLVDSGGFRQTIDGWVINPILNTASVEMTRNGFAAAGAGRFRAVRKGSITGIVVTTTAVAAGTSLTVTAYIKGAGVAGGAGTPTLLSVSLLTGTSRAHITAPTGVYNFDVGDEIYLQLTTVTYTAGGSAIASFDIAN